MNRETAKEINRIYALIDERKNLVLNSVLDGDYAKAKQSAMEAQALLESLNALRNKE